jgi:two-component system, NtrC family, sensor histidine kinase HydH
MNARWKIRPPGLVLAFGCLPLLVGVYAAWDLHRSQSDASEALALNVVSMRAGEEIAIAVRDVRTHLDHFLTDSDPANLGEIRQLRPEMDHWLAEAQRTAVTDREKELVEQIASGYDGFFTDLARMEGLSPDARSSKVPALVAETQEILQPAQDYLDYNEGQIQESSAENQLTTARMVVGLLLLGVCGPVTGLLAGYVVSRTVSRSVVRLSVPILDAAGKLNGVVGPVAISGGLGLEELEAVLRQMGEQIGAVVERLQQSQREALRAEQLAAVGQMAAGFAHELRNPLMAMKILVQSAADRGGRFGLVGRDLEVLEEEMSRLERLTSTLLDFARPPLPEKQVFDAGALVEDCVDLVSSQAAQRDVRIDCDLPEEPLWADADAGQVRQIVLNLLLNALEAIQETGTVRVTLEERRESLADSSEHGDLKQWLTVRVEDSGPGLPRELGQDIFSPFITTKPTGIGLGLSICKRIAEAHGGGVAAMNRPEGGAVFALRLPCACHAAEPAPIV